MKSLPNFCWRFVKNLVKIPQGFSTNTILAHSDRMIYFRENSIMSINLMIEFYFELTLKPSKLFGASPSSFVAMVTYEW